MPLRPAWQQAGLGEEEAAALLGCKLASHRCRMLASPFFPCAAPGGSPSSMPMWRAGGELGALLVLAGAGKPGACRSCCLSKTMSRKATTLCDLQAAGPAHAWLPRGLCLLWRRRPRLAPVAGQHRLVSAAACRKTATALVCTAGRSWWRWCCLTAALFLCPPLQPGHGGRPAGVPPRHVERHQPRLLP